VTSTNVAVPVKSVAKSVAIYVQFLSLTELGNQRL
jgi:hypothetical protein